MTVQQKYLDAFKQFVEAHNAMMKGLKEDPFQLDRPEHLGLDKVKIWEDAEVEAMVKTINHAALDQQEFGKLLRIGNAIIEKVKLWLLH